MLDAMIAHRLFGYTALACTWVGCNLFFTETATDAGAQRDAGALDGGALDAPSEFALSNGAKWSDITGPLAPRIELANATIDADTGAIVGAVEIRQGNTVATNLEVHEGIGFRQAGDVGVLVVQQLVINGQINVVGQRALIILAGDRVVVEASGGIDVAELNKDRPRPGRGGFTDIGATGCGAGSGGLNGGGGGGGGFGAVGAAGGNTQGGVGGAACSTPLHQRLQFGSGGGAANNGVGCGGSGGNSGGALQISARNHITLGGILQANGRGGQQSQGGAGCTRGGGAGGSGGGILLESPIIKGNGKVFANGGAGASAIADGKNGGNAPTPATGGSDDSGGTGGGNGGAINAPAGKGNPGLLGTSAGGGGGGGVGKIEFRTRMSPTSVTTSPAITFELLP